MSAAGYSGTPLAKKLGLKAGSRLYAVAMPDSVRAEIERLVRPAYVARAVKGLEAAHLFTTKRADLKKRLVELREKLSAEGQVWVSWPKKVAKVDTDITDDVIRAVALPLGFVDVKVCAIDAVWSGLKLVIRKSER